MLPTRKSAPRSNRQLDHRRPPDHRKETQTAVVWSCFPFIRSGQNNLAMHSKRGKKTRQTEEEMGRQHQGMDRPGVRQVPKGSGEQGKMEKTRCKIIRGAPTTLAVKGLMMMMMMMMMMTTMMTGLKTRTNLMSWSYYAGPKVGRLQPLTSQSCRYSRR